MSTFQKVTIGGDEYTKSVTQGKFGPFVDYRVIRVSANGKRTSAKMNPTIHRYAIARVEAALAAQTNKDTA
jgi:hypothetical protein